MKIKILKSQCFTRSLFEQNYIRGSILFENISFLTNYDIKTTKREVSHIPPLHGPKLSRYGI